jgi:hypothetical protein
MNAQAMTLEEIRNAGLDVLNERLGAVGAVRFIQQTETGWGDYTAEREQWLGNPGLAMLFDAIKATEKTRQDAVTRL